MRVIAGEAKGRRLRSLPGLKVRPTPDRVKTALFDILGKKVVGSYFLDLFAGVGSVGIEALSRGAQKVFFVEREGRCVKILKENLELLNFSTRAEVYQGDVYKGIRDFIERKLQFDFVFLDPPYAISDLPKVLEHLSARRQIFKKESLVIVQHGKKTSLPDQIGALKLFRRSDFGGTILSFYEVRKNDDCHLPGQF